MSNGVNRNLAMYSRFNKDLFEFLRRRPDVDLEALDHATEEREYPLDKARDNKKIHDRSGDRIFVMSATGYAYIRFNSISKPKYLIRAGGYFSYPFKKLFLTNSVQPGKKISIIIGYEAFIEFASPYSTIKMLNAAGIEVDPATREKQDSLLGQLDRKGSELLTALTDSSMKEETDKILSPGQEYEFLALTGLYCVEEFFVRSPSTLFSVLVSINGAKILDETYTALSNFTSHIRDITAFAEVDDDGVLTGNYVAILKNLNCDTHISLRIKNNAGSNITLDKLFCKYKKA